MISPIIKVEGLSKKFGKKIIFNEINLEFKRGESVAILGNNGTGKSTFLRMICGLANISGGKVVKDKNIKINYIPDNYSKLNLTIEEYMKAIGELEGLREEEYFKKIKELYKEFYLENMKDIPMKNLSKGTLQKVAVLQGLITKPDLLLLDEPLSGQDISSQENFIKIVRELIVKGVTVILCCHELFLVEQIASRVLKIENQEIIELENFKVETDIYKLMTFEKNGISDVQLELELKDVEGYYEDDHILEIRAKRSKSNEILLKMLQRGYILKNFK